MNRSAVSSFVSVPRIAVAILQAWNTPENRQHTLAVDVIQAQNFSRVNYWLQVVANGGMRRLIPAAFCWGICHIVLSHRTQGDYTALGHFLMMVIRVFVNMERGEQDSAEAAEALTTYKWSELQLIANHTNIFELAHVSTLLQNQLHALFLARSQNDLKAFRHWLWTTIGMSPTCLNYTLGRLAYTLLHIIQSATPTHSRSLSQWLLRRHTESPMLTEMAQYVSTVHAEHAQETVTIATMTYQLVCIALRHGVVEDPEYDIWLRILCYLIGYPAPPPVEWQWTFEEKERIRMVHNALRYVQYLCLACESGVEENTRAVVIYFIRALVCSSAPIAFAQLMKDIAYADLETDGKKREVPQDHLAIALKREQTAARIVTPEVFDYAYQTRMRQTYERLLNRLARTAMPLVIPELYIAWMQEPDPVRCAEQAVQFCEAHYAAVAEERNPLQRIQAIEQDDTYWYGLRMWHRGYKNPPPAVPSTPKP